ncbi:MAG TPA: ROK family protein [Xanthobacteraceae bacterium]|nr:ROK family protein [Xanthobacteraceae bacterium]
MAEQATKQATTAPSVATHGAMRLPAVDLDSYNLELKDDEGFLGDRASKGAFRAILENWRKAMRKNGPDPFGDEPSEEISKKKLDSIITDGGPDAAGVLHGAIEDFAQELALITRRFLKTKGWRDTERIMIGGGFRASRVGELAIGRAGVILKSDGIAIDIIPIRNDPDEAGLLGAPQLAPTWVFQAHDAILGVDIGGTNIRAGVVELNLKKARDLSKSAVWKFELWRHGDEEVKRDDAVEGLVEMLEMLIKSARKEGLRLAPFIGIGCPGHIEEDGSITRGAQNLPGNWESSRFNLPNTLREAIPKIGPDETAIVMHNDAVVQGLSEVPYMKDVERWGVLTIGTGLGNARFTNRKPGED